MSSCDQQPWKTYTGTGIYNRWVRLILRKKLLEKLANRKKCIEKEFFFKKPKKTKKPTGLRLKKKPGFFPTLALTIYILDRFRYKSGYRQQKGERIRKVNADRSVKFNKK